MTNGERSWFFVLGSCFRNASRGGARARWEVAKSVFVIRHSSLPGPGNPAQAPAMPSGATPPADHLYDRALENSSLEESRRMLAAIERDRSAVAKLLHDTVCQSLSGLQLLGSTLLLSNSNENGASKDAGAGLNDLVILLRQASAELRTVIDLLLPPPMRAAGLIVSLVGLCAETSERVPCEFHCADRRAKIDPAIAEQFSKIARTVVMAIAQRGAATRIEVSLEIHSSEAAIISIWNDAAPVAEASRNEHLPFNVGLLELRARAIGGSLTALPDAGGTRVTCRV